MQELIERLQKLGKKTMHMDIGPLLRICIEAADAIESLQAEKDEIEKNGIDLIDDLHKAWAERNALQARINELEQGEPVAYMHTMDNTDGLEGNEPEIVVTFNISNPFGIPGVHYSKSYPVTCEPLYTHPAKTQPLTDEQKMFTSGHCKERSKGVCHLHNLQCGYPACDRKEAAHGIGSQQ